MRPIPEEMRLQYKEQFARRPPGCPHPGLPELRARGPDVGGLDRGDPDPGRLPRHAASTVSKATADLGAEETFAAPRVVAVLSSAYMSSPRGAAAVAGAAGGGRRGHQAADRAHPGERHAHRRAVRRVHPDRPGAGGRHAGRDAAAVGVRPAWHAPGSRPGPTGRASLARCRGSRKCPRGTRTSPAGRRHLSCCATSSPGATPRPPRSVRARRRGQDPARAGVRAPVQGRLRPHLVGARGAGRGDQPVVRRAGPPAGAASRRQRGGGGRGGARGAAHATPTVRWLLIFDNADDPELLEPWLPSGTGHVIITSRNKAWTPLAEPLEVDVFAREESVAHLLRARAATGPGRRRPGRGGARRPAARDRAGERVAGSRPACPAAPTWRSWRSRPPASSR